VAIDANEVVEVFKWLGSVATAAVAVFGLLYKVVNAMVTKKVKDQLGVLAEKMAETTSAQIDALRDEVREQHAASEERRQDADERSDRRLDQITRRIDDLLSRRGP
jgi:F0F1-type ATP synthase membrane subunit b/b'